jgi:hypothetical protein
MAVDPSRIERARTLLQTVRHAAMATVNADGSPHNTPYFFMHNRALTRLYWGSHPDSQHSQNILRTGQLFVVLFDAFERGGGLYIRAEHGRIAKDSELTEALTVHNTLRAKENKPALTREYYENASPPRMWIADITGLWVNYAERDAQGHIIRDMRAEVTAADLLG